MLPSEISQAEPRQAVVDDAQRRAELGRTDFLRMLVAQLENQDPLSPQDPAEFTAQLAQFSSLEQMIAMRSGIDDLIGVLSARSDSAAEDVTRDLLAAGLIGKEITARGSQFELDGSGGGVRLAFDLDGNASDTIVRIRDHRGIEIDSVALGRLGQGRHEIAWDGLRSDGSPFSSGVYSFEVDASLGPQPVGSTRFIGGRVTGTSLGAGDPVLQIGDVIVPWADVVEIREAGSGS